MPKGYCWLGAVPGVVRENRCVCGEYQGKQKLIKILRNLRRCDNIIANDINE